MSKPDNATTAQVRLPSPDLNADLAFFTKELGFRLDTIFPADDPAIAELSGHGLNIRLERGAAGAPVTLRLLSDDPENFAGSERLLTAPNGTRIEIAEADPAMVQPPTEHTFGIRRLKDEAPWVIGRAGMHYRDLIPGRLGGSIIASHIRIPEGGPVPDMVHYHDVGFQLIFCINGWVRLVYEDQGPPFILSAGDCVIQPPKIRHRVLEAGDDLQVIEIGVPAEHVTTIDHDMELPTATIDRDREFAGQRFCHHKAADATWQPWRLPGFTACDTGIATATKGVAGVQIVKPDGSGVVPPPAAHDIDIHFTFVMAGTMTLKADNHPGHLLEAGDAFVIPPGQATNYTSCSRDLQLIEVCLPA